MAVQRRPAGAHIIESMWHAGTSHSRWKKDTARETSSPRVKRDPRSSWIEVGHAEQPVTIHGANDSFTLDQPGTAGSAHAVQD